ncbi:MAG: anthranilate phosphoribosyltransferase [Micrococcales bacterium]
MPDKLGRMTHSLNWPSILGKLLAKSDLDRAEAAWAMTEIMSGEAAEAQIGAFMMALRARGESVDEVAGLFDVMLEHSVLLNTGDDAVDIVGTGGDLAGTVNVSSMAAVLCSAAGVPVMKHGSRSASGKTGSSEMLEVLGIRLDLSPERVSDVFREIGLTFFFAPVFHPAMRHVAPVRKALGVPTTFNFLGPLANPAQPIATSLGVANRSVAPLMAAEVAARGRSALVFRGSDGLDELTTTGISEIWQVSGGEVREFVLDPTILGITKANGSDLVGGDAQQNAKIARIVLGADNWDAALQPARDIVRLNAAGGIVAYQMAKDAKLAELDIHERFAAALSEVDTALASGAPAQKLSSWITATQA